MFHNFDSYKQLEELTDSLVTDGPIDKEKSLNEKNSDSILFLNIDIKQDICSTKFEKDLKRLPSNLKFIRKYIYLDFFPKLDKIIGDLESIKQSANYDENICNVRPLFVHKLSNITCFDLFETNNIKKSVINKMIYGTINGTLGIYDLESQKILIEKQMNPVGSITKSRVDVIGTSTIKNFDNYITRIAVQLRGDPNIQILTFNHTFSVISNECVVNLKDGLQNDLNISLSSLVSDIKFSKDTFYMSLIDYLGGVKIYKFNDLPNVGVFSKEKIPQKRENPAGMQFSFGSSKVQVLNNNLPKKSSDPLLNTSTNIQAILIAYVKHKEIENCSIIPINNLKSKEDINTLASNNNNNNNNLANKEKKVAQPSNTKNVPTDKNLRTEKLSKKEANLQITRDSGVYETPTSNNPFYDNKQAFDDKSSSDVTPLQNFSKNHPSISFIQKKFVYQEKSSGGYVSNTITIGAYVSFYGSNNFKYISLYPYLTESMKNVNKAAKYKGAAVTSAEDSLALTSQMQKKERDYISFIKSKLDHVNSEINQLANASSSNFSELRIRDQNKEKSSISSNSNQITISDISNKEVTKKEIDFIMLYPITCLVGQNNLSKLINTICIGMKDGSILLWDTELHTDIVLFKEKRAEIVQMSVDDKFLTSGSLDGQIHVYNMIEKKLIFRCYNSPHRNYPIQSIFPFFYQMSLAIDHNQNIIIYNNKEKHKAGKLILEHKNKNYKINYFNRILLGCNKVFVASKDKNEKVRPNLLEMILFQQQVDKPVLEEFMKSNMNYFNYIQSYYSKQPLPVSNKSFLVVYKIKDIMFKCYPQLVIANKKGISLHHLITKYDINNLPSFSDDKFAKIFMFTDKNEKNKKKNYLKEIVEQESERDHENLSNASIVENKITKYSDKEFIKIKNDLRKETEPKQKTTQSYLEETQAKSPIHQAQNEFKSTQKQNIFYFSFRNIRDRYQYKEHRLNRIQARDERIMKELKLPEIKTGSDKLKDNRIKNIV